jgi:hypothetical protein
MRPLPWQWAAFYCCIQLCLPVYGQSLTAVAILTKTEQAYQLSNKLIDDGETRQIARLNGTTITTHSYYFVACFGDFLSYQSIIDKNVRTEVSPPSLPRHNNKKGRSIYEQLFEEHDTTHRISYHTISDQPGDFVNESGDTAKLNQMKAIIQSLQSHDNMLSLFLSLRSPDVMNLPGGPASLLHADTIFLLQDTVFHKTPCYTVQTVSGNYKTLEKWLAMDQEDAGNKARPKNKKSIAPVASTDTVIVSIYFIRKDNFLIRRLQRKMYEKGHVVIDSTMEGNPQYDYLNQ